MIKNKKIVQCLTACIIITSSQLTTYSINYDSIIPYVEEEDKELLQNLNTIDTDILLSSANYAKNNISNEKETFELPYHPIATVWVSNESEIYSDTTENSKTNEKLSSGDKLQIEVKNDDWARIVSTDTFIKTENISYKKVYKNLNLIRSVIDLLNFREEPSMESKIKTILTPGTVVNVMDYDDEWAYISVNGEIGFVQRRFLSDKEPKLVPLGTFFITHYCNCSICCGQYAGKGTTSTGAKLQAGKTIAVDPSVIPYGTEVLINGETYVAQDCGGGVKGNHIDIYCETHEEALKSGTFYIEVFKVNN